MKIKIDLKLAKSCIAKQKKRGIYEGAKIGIINDDAPAVLAAYKGEAILFIPEPNNLKVVDIYKPMNENRQKHTGLITSCTMINVPAHYVTEIKAPGVDVAIIEGNEEFEVAVTRTSYAHHTFKVCAKNKKEAKRMALEAAGNHAFSESSADYEANVLKAARTP